MSLIGIKKLSIENAIYGATNALKDGCDCTDILIVVANKRTGEFKLSVWPPDLQNAVIMTEKTIQRLKQMRQQKVGSGIIH